MFYITANNSKIIRSKDYLEILKIFNTLRDTYKKSVIPIKKSYPTKMVLPNMIIEIIEE